MGRNNGGVNNNSASRGKTHSFHKARRIKAKVSKKRSGVAERHKIVAIEGVKGAARSGKGKRKQLKQERRALREKEAKESGMDVETTAKPSSKKTKKATKAQQQPTVDVMQE